MMKRTLIFLIVMFAANIEFAFADQPYLVPCPKITSVTGPAGSNTQRKGFIFYSSRSNESYLAEKFIGADLNNTRTFSCNYEVSDGTQVTAEFTRSKCSAKVGFDSSGKCNNSNPGQCTALCIY